MNPIFNFIFAKQYRVVILLNVVIISLLLIYLNLFGKLTSKYTVYFFMAPIFLFVLFKIKSPTIKIAAPLFVLIFTENIIISRVPISDFFKVGITFIFGATVLVSILWHQKTLKFPKYIVSALLLFQLSAIISIILGSAKGPVYLNLNIEDFITYFIGFSIFLYVGYQTFDDPSDVYKIVLFILLYAFLTAVRQIFSIMTGKI